MSASLKTGERSDDRIVLTASSHVTSPIRPPRGVAGQLYWAAGGGAAEPWRATYWSESDRVSVSTSLRYSSQAAAICVYEGVRSMCIDWEQLDTGCCHQNADSQKVEQALVKSARCVQYGFVDADQTDAGGTRRDWGIRPAPLSLPGSFHLGAHGQIKQLYATLKDRKNKKSPNECSSNMLWPPSPSLYLFIRGKAFTKRGQGHGFPLWDHRLFQNKDIPLFPPHPGIQK